MSSAAENLAEVFYIVCCVFINFLAITIYWPELFFISLLKINLCAWDSHLFSLYMIQRMSGNNKSKILGGSINYELKWYVVTSVLYYGSFSLQDWALLCDLTIGHRCCLCQKTKTFRRMHERTRRSTCRSLHTICDTHGGTAKRIVAESLRYRFWHIGIDLNRGTDQAMAYLQELSQDVLGQKNN